ncbi:hypothetical protein RND81_09G002500 [Saponaria officinalis]|uniref:60S ribosomal protein L18a-like protein n=1 Tax=Saponaria officinalis TaxID=3572 RepID=A0AAW1IGG8_SAPOF
MSKEGKVVEHEHESNQAYGTFQGIPSLTSPATGFPQPAPPPGAYAYQSVPGYTVADGTPVREYYHRLPCCGIGCGWFLFIIGFFLAGIPWYAAAIFLLCCRNVDPREKPAYVCCTIAAVLAIIATVFGVTKLND